MQYKLYGSTGAGVSAVGFGGMRFDLKQSNATNAKLLHYALDKGINYFDTAPGYCEDKSEDIFGIALRQMKPGTFYVSTKRMPTENDTPKLVRADVEKSLSRLGVEQIDFFHCWCFRQMSHYDLCMKPGGLYETVQKMQEEGKIRHIVFSSHQPGGEIRKVVETGKFRGVLLGANILNFPYRWDGVEAAYRDGCGVVAMNPLAGGEIPRHEKELSFLSLDGRSPTESALRFMICCPQITVTLVGFTTTQQIDESCRIACEGEPLTQEQIESIRSRLGENMNSLCTGCGYCENCPAGINVPGHMQIFNDHHLFGKDDAKMSDQLKFEYSWGRLVGRAGEYAKCVRCGACEVACTQRLPIMERLGEFVRWQPKPAESDKKK